MAGRIITLLGADGAGKSTLARRLRSKLGSRGRYVYLGSNPSAATHTLLTTRLWWAAKVLAGRRLHDGGPPERDGRRRPSGVVERALQHLKSIVVAMLRALNDLYRLLIAELYRWSGKVVILDRHPYADYSALRVEDGPGWRRVGDRLHGWLLGHAYPKPSHVVLLDAPAGVLYARKPEGSPEAIAARRTEYLRVAEALGDATVIDASRSEDDVFAHVLRLVLDDMAVAPKGRVDRHGRSTGSSAADT